MLIDWLLALLPILVIIGLMVGFRWGAAKAGPAGWFVALLVAILRFGAGIDLIALAHVKALLLTSDVLLITSPRAHPRCRSSTRWGTRI